MADESAPEDNCAELKKTASSLYEIGLGASRRNERDEARIFLSLAAGVYEKAKDEVGAALARHFASTI